MTLNPGSMRDRVTLQKRGSIDPYTGETWIDVATSWAEFRPTRGREFREGSVPLGEKRAVFTVLYREDLEQVDRLIHHGRGRDKSWNIRDVVPIGFKEGTDIHCSRTDAGD